MTSTTKKWAALGAVVLVLGIGAAVFVQQTGERIKTEVNAALAALPGITGHEVGSMDFACLSRTLTMKNVRLTFKDQSATTDITLEEVVAVKPNVDALQGKPGAGTLLLDELRLTGYAVKAVSTAPAMTAASRVDTLRLTQLHADLPGLMNLMPVDGKPRDAARGLKALASIKAASLAYTGIRTGMDMPGLTAMDMRMDSMEARDFSMASTGSLTAKNCAVDIKNIGQLTVGALEATALFLPDLSKLPPELLTENQKELSPQAAEKILLAIIPQNRALVGSLVLRDIKESISGGMISAKLVSASDIWIEPLQGRVSAEDLDLPGQLLSPVLPMLGYARAVLSGDMSLMPVKTADKAGQVRMEVALDMRDAGHVQLGMSVQDAAATTRLANLDDLLLRELSLAYADKGLAGRGVKLLQTFGMPPAAIQAQAATLARGTVGTQPENIKSFMEFVERPGKITLNYTPTRPLTLREFETKGDPQGLRVTSVPGPRTLEELLK